MVRHTCSAICPWTQDQTLTLTDLFWNSTHLHGYTRQMSSSTYGVRLLYLLVIG